MDSVVVGLSGGVDSSVCAAILKEQGYKVYGLFLDIGISSASDAAKTAEQLGIEFSVLDIRKELEENVCIPFINAYLSGKTPSPCTICNPLVKFPSLIAEADKRNAKFIATGHYARVDTSGDRYSLMCALSDNDQAYMLARLPQDILSRLLLPLGEFESKTAVREKAISLGLNTASKPDSMEICFIPDGDYAAFIESRGIIPPCGNFVDENGNVLGKHCGIHHYTIGQRRGLGIAAGERMFVKSIDPESNTVILSKATGLNTQNIHVSNINWVSWAKYEQPFHAEIKVRHSRTKYGAAITPSGDDLFIVLDSPIRRPALGQLAVLYDGDRVICGGDIL